MSSIRLSPKYGVNASMLVCPFCGQSTSVALLGKIKGMTDAEAPRSMADQEPCQECQDYAKQGVLLRERDGDMITGRMWVITPEAYRRMFTGVNMDARMCHIDPESAKAVGLPYNEGVDVAST